MTIVCFFCLNCYQAGLGACVGHGVDVGRQVAEVTLAQRPRQLPHELAPRVRVHVCTKPPRQLRAKVPLRVHLVKQKLT
eukprot:1194480-Prorocentrum_minimum.AAC.6